MRLDAGAIRVGVEPRIELTHFLRLAGDQTYTRGRVAYRAVAIARVLRARYGWLFFPSASHTFALDS